ncbi:alpha-1,4-glucan--maltose-1-phosphate maltosyltransferase, partial [Escherichia coli]|nr:alpha-1,4-glucan--maltose-1-phosphate maltosyltransferase [Escherichia coli]
GDLRARIAAALSDETRAILQAHPVRDLLTRGKTRKIKVDRREALYSSWSEFFPRSNGGYGENGELLHGTFKTAVAQLDRAQRMG